jgi:hypothetical protein
MNILDPRDFLDISGNALFIRGPHKHTTLRRCAKDMLSLPTSEKRKWPNCMIANLQFTQSCINFIHDLRTFTSSKDSCTLLDRTGYENFPGETLVATIPHMQTSSGAFIFIFLNFIIERIQSKDCDIIQ